MRGSEKIIKSTAVTLLALLACNGCVSAPKLGASDRETLTHGAVQMTLVNGKTTQTEVLEAFGAPNITTLDASGEEVWTYRRHATVSSVSQQQGYFNVLVFGSSSASQDASASARSMTLIIKFDSAKRVSDFRSMSSSF
jgi:outer membrane protein assembly factor BamE (lipoprotein component of BamABCDE complex)